MAYKVLIKDTKTGEERLIPLDLEWHEASLFWWQDGNFGCDCNRGDTFQRDKGNSDADEDCNTEENRYYVAYALFENGDKIAIDD